MMIDYLDSANIVVSTEVETLIASELTQQLVENQLKIIRLLQEKTLEQPTLEQPTEQWYLSELDQAIDELQKLMAALKNGNFVILTKP